MHASVHAINVNENSFLRKDQKKDNQERLAKEELDSRDKHHKICKGILLIMLGTEKVLLLRSLVSKILKLLFAAIRQ